MVYSVIVIFFAFSVLMVRYVLTKSMGYVSVEATIPVNPPQISFYVYDSLLFGIDGYKLDLKIS